MGVTLLVSIFKPTVIGEMFKYCWTHFYVYGSNINKSVKWDTDHTRRDPQQPGPPFNPQIIAHVHFASNTRVSNYF